MDYRRIHEVCDRVIALAADHQIIVFTHNIWFAAQLRKADKKNWKYYDVRLEGGDARLVTAASHPRVDTIAQVSGRVSKMIEAAEKQQGRSERPWSKGVRRTPGAFAKSWSSTKCSRALSKDTLRT
jgi:hypothetical protein